MRLRELGTRWYVTKVIKFEAKATDCGGEGI
jgi:hypothetical protein